MPSAARLRQDYSAEELRGLARRVEGGQPEPAASVAGCGPGWHGSGRRAKIGGIDRQTLREFIGLQPRAGGKQHWPVRGRAGGSMRFSSSQPHFDFEKTGSRPSSNTGYK
jgi:hypothetical protein